MTKYVVLLRGIGPMNPNMRNDKLRGVLEGLGFTNVQSVISTGNLIFESDTDHKTLEATIERAWPEQLGFTSMTIIRSRQDLQSFIDKNPFKGIEDAPNSRLNITFLKNKPITDLKFPYYNENKGYTVLGIEDQVVYTVIDLSGAKTPDLMAWLEKQFGKEITTRTWKTIHRIVKRMDA